MHYRGETDTEESFSSKKGEGTCTIEEKQTQKNLSPARRKKEQTQEKEKRTLKEEGTDTTEDKQTQKNHSPGRRKKKQTL